LCTARGSIQQQSAFLFGDGLSRHHGALFPARAVESVIDAQRRRTPLALGRTERSQLAFRAATRHRADFRNSDGNVSLRLSLSLSLSLSGASAVQLHFSVRRALMRRRRGVFGTVKESAEIALGRQKVQLVARADRAVLANVVFKRSGHMCVNQI
jgi:hypothetical protein